MMATLRRPWLLALLLWCAVLVSAAGVIWSRHRARELFVELEQLNRQRDQLDVSWGQLQLEQSSLSQHARVESTARQRLDMLMPDPVSIQVVLP
jgi:cell division protein FtsL